MLFGSFYNAEDFFIDRGFQVTYFNFNFNDAKLYARLLKFYFFVFNSIWRPLVGVYWVFWNILLLLYSRTLVEAESLMDCLGKGYPGLRGPKLAKLEICYRTMVRTKTYYFYLFQGWVSSISTRPINGFYIKDGCSLSLQDLLMDFILRMGVLYLYKIY